MEIALWLLGIALGITTAGWMICFVENKKLDIEHDSLMKLISALMEENITLIQRLNAGTAGAVMSDLKTADTVTPGE